jgi:hypothetical protein
LDSWSRSHLTLMALEAKKSVLEAARAAALAAHCAAGLASSAGLRPAARLLRTAEALSRSAIAALTCPSPPTPAPAAGPAVAPAVPSARSRRRRNKKQKEEKIESAMPVDASVAPPSVLSADATVFVPGVVRTLKARSSRERSPRRCSLSPSASSASALVGTASGSASDGLFTVGQSVMLGGLESRPELSGRVSILSFDSVAGRYAVTVDATGERIKVKGVNLHSPS